MRKWQWPHLYAPFFPHETITAAKSYVFYRQQRGMCKFVMKLMQAIQKNCSVVIVWAARIMQYYKFLVGYLFRALFY